MLSALLAPLSPELFAREHAGRAPLHLPGAPARFADLPRGSDLPSLLAAGPGQIDRIRAGIGRPIEEAVTPAKLLAELAAERCSLRLRRAQLCDDRLRRLALDLVVALEEEINVNLYHSPGAEAAGLAPHHDPYDVFVLQLEGEKHWQLLATDGFASDCERELSLSAGDVLYLPAGLRHVVRTVVERPSLHLTVGIYRKSGRSLVEWLGSELGRDPALAATLPLAAAGPPLAAFADLDRAAAALLADPDRAARFADYRRAIDYERTLASCEAHENSAARGYR